MQRFGVRGCHPRAHSCYYSPVGLRGKIVRALRSQPLFVINTLRPKNRPNNLSNNIHCRFGSAPRRSAAASPHARSIVCKYTLQGGSGRACTRSTPARARTRRPHTTVRLQTPFLTGPSCAASLQAALGCAVGTVWVHLGRRQQMPSGRPAGRGLVTRDHFSVRQFADTSLHPG